MRITENGLADRYMSTIALTRDRITKLQTQIASGKLVQKVSDDPQGTNYIMRLKSFISANEQYSKNTEEAQTMVDASMSALDNFGQVLGSVKELTVQANNGGLTADDLKSYAQKIDQYLDEAVNIANTKYNGKSLFAGSNTLQTPFALSGDRSAVTANASGITGTIEFPIGDGMTQRTNIDGEQAFQGTAIFETIIRLRDALNSGQPPAPADIQTLDAGLEHVLQQTSITGVISEQLTNNTTRLESQKTQLQGFLSIQNDTDIAAAITRMSQEQINLEAALKVTAQIIPKSLLDFLTSI